MDFDFRKYRLANPWQIINVQSSSTACGRYKTREAAVEAGKLYRGGIVQIDDVQKVVYVSEIYGC